MLKKQIAIGDEKILNADIGEHVGYEIGAKMVKNYYDVHSENSYQFIGKKILNEILSQPDCIGIYILRALNDTGDKTYVILGVNENGSPIFQYPAVNTNGELKIQEGIVADRNLEVPGWYDFFK